MRVKVILLILFSVSIIAVSTYFFGSTSEIQKHSIAASESDCINHIVKLSWNSETGPAEAILTLRETCSVENLKEFKEIVEQSMNSIRKNTPMNILVSCEGHNGINQYTKLKTSLVGFQKICKEDGSCRGRFKMLESGRDMASDIPWSSLEEVFVEKVCPAIGSKLQ